MKKILLILSVVFVILTFAGAIYVLMNKGTVSAGYAVVPMTLSLACSNVYRTLNKKISDNNVTEQI